MIFDVDKCKINIGRKKYATQFLMDWDTSNNNLDVAWTKYNIKETDFRIKTASFTTPFDIDLTTGSYCVRISSPYHENFAGIILANDYDEDTGLYTYQCQDWSRNYISKFELLSYDKDVYHLLRWLLTRGKVGSFYKSFTKEQLNNWQGELSGLMAKWRYDQSLYNNIISTKPMEQKPKMIIRDKTWMETIRALTIGTIRYVDLWFNDRGVLQITPLDRNDWLNTGLILNADNTQSRKFKFDTTNAITDVIVNGEDFNGGQALVSEKLINLDLEAFFGDVATSINGSTTTVQNKTTTKTTTNNNVSKTTNNNPFNNKKKKIMVSADNGSGSFKSEIINLLKQDGWTVVDVGTYSDAHSESYRRIDSSFAVNLVIYNGFCAGTIRECYTGWLKGHHENKGVTLVNMWDTSSWTNPNGMKPYRYGDFTGYSASRAWDDNFSSSDPSISNVDDYLRKYNVKYCCGTKPSEAMEQFRAGGYYAYKEKKNTTTTNTNNTSTTGNTTIVTFNDTLINSTEATNKITEHTRDYLSCKITLPLGNTALKQVHTNQFLFTNLPPEFELANWTLLAQVLSSQYNRYTGADYILNRWYIEGNNITVEANGTGKMELSLNAFASSTAKYGEDYRSMSKAYNDTVNKQNKSNTSASKTTSNATSSILNQSNIKKYKIPEIIYKKAEYICKGKKSDKDKAYALYKWMDNNIGYESYYNHKYSEVEVYRRGKGNCVDNSRLYRLFCLSVGLKCKFVHGFSCCSGGECANHQWNKVKIGNKWQTVDCGRQLASWGSHWGNCSGGTQDTETSW